MICFNGLFFLKKNEKQKQKTKKEEKRIMMIPLTNEEYFDNDVCMNCYHVMDLPVIFYLPDDRGFLELCQSCAFGVYQCAGCRNLVSHLEAFPYREMVYTGPMNTFDDIHIFCRECVDSNEPYHNLYPPNDKEYDTDVDNDLETCDDESMTQVLC